MKFRLAGEHKQLRVRYDQCIIPAALCNRARRPRKVTVEGRFNESAGRFDATVVLVWLGGKYEASRGPDGKWVQEPDCL